MDPSSVLQSPAALLRAVAGDVQVQRDTVAGDGTAALSAERNPLVTRGGGVCVLELFLPKYGTSVVAGSVLGRWMRSEEHQNHSLHDDPGGGGGVSGAEHAGGKALSGALRRTWAAVDTAAVFPGLGDAPLAADVRPEHPLAEPTGAVDAALRSAMRSMLEPFLGSLHPVFLVLAQPHIRGAPLVDASATDLSASMAAASRAAFSDSRVAGHSSRKDGATELWSCARVFAAGSVELHTVIEGPDMPGLTRAIAAAEGLVGTAMRNLRGAVVDVAPSPASAIDADASFARSTARRHTRDGSLLLSQSAAQLSASRRRSSASMSIDPAARVLPLSISVTVSSVTAAFALPSLAAKCHAAAFKVQCAWRRRQALKRIGEFIGGKFYTHAEVAALRAQQLAEAQEAERLRVRRNAAAATLQRLWMGHVGRCAARLRRADIQESAKLKAVYARRKTKRTGLYGTVGVPNSLEPKVRILRKAAHAAAAAAAPSGAADAKRRTSLDPAAAATAGIRSPRNAAAGRAPTAAADEKPIPPGKYLDFGALTHDERTIAMRKARVKV